MGSPASKSSELLAALKVRRDRSTLENTLLLLAWAAVYFLAGKLGLKLASVNASASAVWPGTGIALAAFLLLGYRIWPAILAAAFLVNITTTPAVLVSLGIAIGNTLEGLLGAYLVIRFAGGRNAFERAETIFRFALLAGMCSTMVSATFGVTSICLAGFARWVDYGTVWLTWWLGDAVGALVVAPLILLWSGRPQWRTGRPWTWGQVSDGASLLLCVFISGMLVFGGLFPPPIRNYPLAFLCIPFLIWPAFRVGPRGAATAVFLLSGIAIWGTLHGFGPFVKETQNVSLLLVQAFTGVMAVTTLGLSAVVAERTRDEQALQRAHDELETQVQQRTLDLSKAVALLQADIIERKRIEEELRVKTDYAKLLQIVAVAANESSTPEEALQLSIDQVCAYSGWPVGHAYLIGQEAGGHFVSAGIWCLADPARFEPFRHATEANTLALERGLPGQVLAAGKPIIIPDVLSNPNFLRGPFAAQTGLKSGFGLPVLTGKQIVAVLEFFSDREMHLEEAFQEVLTQVGLQLGRVFERRRAAEVIRQSGERFRAVAETAPEGILTADTDSTILFANRAAERMFGYTVDEMIGQDLTMLMADHLRPMHSGGMKRYVETGQKHLDWECVELVGRHKSGKEIPVELSLGEFTRDGKRIFAGIIRDITERKLAEASLRQLTARLLQAQDEERRRIARELHDSTGQYLSAIQMNLGILEQAKNKLEPSEVNSLADSIMLAERCVAEIRTLSYLLHPPMLDEVGLGSAVPWYAQGFAKRSGLKVKLDVPADFPKLPQEVEVVLFRVLQEALTNIHRHSGSAVASIRLSVDDSNVRLEISDQGKGMPAGMIKRAAGDSRGLGVGIAGMRERVKELGGRLEIQSSAQGTVVRASLPLQASRSEAEANKAGAEIRQS